MRMVKTLSKQEIDDDTVCSSIWSLGVGDLLQPILACYLLGSGTYSESIELDYRIVCPSVYVPT